MLFWKCIFILYFWCPYSCYFERVLLIKYYFYLCWYDTYCKTYAVNEYSYFHLVLLSNSLFFYQVSPYWSFWQFHQKEYLNTKAQLWHFLINKLVSVTPLTNNTWRKLRSSAFQQYQGLGVADRVFITKY